MSDRSKFNPLDFLLKAGALDKMAMVKKHSICSHLQLHYGRKVSITKQEATLALIMVTLIYLHHLRYVILQRKLRLQAMPWSSSGDIREPSSACC